MATQPVCVVVGVGPGIGGALARKWANEGFQVALLSRSESTLAPFVDELDNAVAYPCDVTDPDAVKETFAHIERDLGPVDTLLYNAGSGVFGGYTEIDLEAFELSWKVNTRGLLLVAREVAPKMAERGCGILGITGATASLRGKPFTTAFASSKAAQRSLAQSLARELGPQGVHVFYAIIDGMVDLPRTRKQMPDKPDQAFLNPNDIASAYWSLSLQPRSTWTFELDLRPHCESW